MSQFIFRDTIKEPNAEEIKHIQDSGAPVRPNLAHEKQQIFERLNNLFATIEDSQMHVDCVIIPELEHEYRLNSASGLQRKRRGVPPVNLYQQTGQQAMTGYAWLRVTGDDFMDMSWRELEHVASILKAIEK